MIKIALGMPIAILGAVLLLMPRLMQRGILFAVPVADDFRSTPEGRRAVTIYRVWVALALALALLLWMLLPSSLATELMPLGLLAVGAAAYYGVHRSLLPFTVIKSPGQRFMDLTAEPDRLPLWTWFAIGPFVVLAIAACFLWAHWDAIPMRFPAHFGMNGVPDRWADKNFRGVYGPLFFGGELCALLIAVGLAGWYGARRSSLRPRILGLMTATGYFMALVFGSIAVQPELGFPVWLIMIPILCMPMLFIGYVLRNSGEPSDPSETTPQDCWKGGMIYYNTNDPVLFVEKRIGYGYTVNFGNRWSWFIVAAIAVVIASAPLLLV